MARHMAGGGRRDAVTESPWHRSPPARTRGGVRRSLRYAAPRRSQGLWALQGKRIVRRQRVREVAMDWWIWLLIAVIVLAVVVMGAVVVQARRRRGKVISVQRRGRGGTSRARP